MNEEPIEKVDITNAAIQNPRWWKPWVEVFYIDVPNLLSLDIFERHKLRPWGFKKLDNKEIPYIGVMCHIRKSRIVDFFHCMIELRKLILMCGHGDYDKFCQEAIGDEMTDELEITTDDGT